MAKDVTLTAEPRADRGKSAVNKLRSQGRLPGVIYGSGLDSTSLTIDRHDLIRTLHAHGAHPLVTLQLDGQEYLALVKEVQMDPVRLEALHVDFLRVSEDKPVHSEVALELTGTPVGVKDEGGVLEVQIRTLSIEALPRALPESIGFDVAHLGMGDVARVGDIPVPEGVTILTDAEETICSVTAPRVEVEAPVVEELEEGVEPVEGEEAPAEEAPAAEEGEEG